MRGSSRILFGFRKSDQENSAAFLYNDYEKEGVIP